MQLPEPVQIRYHEGQGEPALFLHANGFVPRAYTPFFQALKQRLQLSAVSTRALNGHPLPRRRFDWKDLGQEVGKWQSEQGTTPVIGVGHSMGATALIYAAQAYPRAFRALVLIEPASIQAHLAKLIRVMPFALLKKFQPMRGAYIKRDRWPDQAAFLESCRRSGLYRRFDASAMATYCKYAIREQDGEFVLSYPKLWEAYNYGMVCDPIPALNRVRIPVIGLRADDSFFMNSATWKRFTDSPSMLWHKKIDGFGHLLPLEGPTACAQGVLRGLDGL